ncbi:DUF1998 domain-containing protein [Deinococcus soli (ex Cha et al. 2016)]|uniref:Zn ribbon nucleic-acid-binding protein n=2 Tax=Deinococcus soli (ex Cha et al. 2016) TaxID=1309411 RepID=A0ACC6KML1_9DEIO|nr:DUF1998 domain-containing protein [Deinococcus soli (ex Cha et al. 2016)]MDR6220961.1 Zn ribbon nucleic-acid-binding protein [Deinococcus soli (ex Cha et al. 2016)]MDR6330955.1 Zn ribbon nucleic-acid-binding protein [Deinococcus soli (ex Cha et al. 2016)]MDR6753684.1 Zn ribbon nucleic-acid-binding protein [Deinococcus soli (ex Cha et al. 2016)]
MTKLPLRRTQLITPTGVGAVTVDKEGTSLVTAGLDYWFRRPGQNDPPEAELAEFKIREWRLERQLGVDHFRMPPDMRRPRRGGAEVVNANLQIPFLRFPSWFVCPHCHTMSQENAWERDKVLCRTCKAHGFDKRRMFQVQIAAICEHGHLLDFPFREWAHSSVSPQCSGTLTLRVNGPSFADQIVACTCGISRSLSGILDAERIGDDDLRYETVLTTKLTGDAERQFSCPGERAWFGKDAPRQACGQHVRGALTSATNTYFPDVRSAIFLPQGTGSSVSPELMQALDAPGPAARIGAWKDVNESAPGTVTVDIAYKTLSTAFPLLVSRHGQAALRTALEVIFGSVAPSTSAHLDQPATEDETMRFDEYQILRTQRKDRDLVVRQAEMSDYGTWQSVFSRIGLVHSLRETRVLAGFTRGVGHHRTSLTFRRNLLWREPPSPETTWLPAVEVYGEGLYLELNPERLAVWETSAPAVARLRALQQRHEVVMARTGREGAVVSPRLLLVHTLAHLLINRLTFECGYPAASLRERLYVSERPGSEMAALLIYTSSGDSAGTLGGLVRMGDPDRLVPLLEAAVREAEWCSNDPVCMELGAMDGQGQNGMNLAACHSCSLVPETSCELFNALLDRGVVVGTVTEPGTGFLSEVLGQSGRGGDQRGE